MDNREELLILADLLAGTINAVKVSSIKDDSERERKVDAHNLVNRFLQFLLSILHLSEESATISLPSFKGIKLNDPGSIDVLARACMEAFLVFHRVYYSPGNPDDIKFRYGVYKAGGFAEGQSIPASQPEYMEIKKQERALLVGIVDDLKTNPIFAALKDGQKRGLVAGTQKDLWRWDPHLRKVLPWSEIAADAGFSTMLSSYIYTHLCGHAHSGSRSVLQTQIAIIRGDTKSLISPSINTLKILCANMILEYSSLFPEAKTELERTGETTFINTWVEIGKKL